MDVRHFSPGQIVGIECHSFRGIEHVVVHATPDVNYFVAPNGAGKSTILYAIALCLGSRLPELRQIDTLIRERCQYGSVMLSICDNDELPEAEAHDMFTSVTEAYNKDTNRYAVRRLHQKEPDRFDRLFVVSVSLDRKGAMQTYYNGRLIDQDGLRRKVHEKFGIRIDNPFQSMMQTNAQQLTLITPSERLGHFLGLIFPEIATAFNTLKPKIATVIEFYNAEDKATKTRYTSVCEDFLRVARQVELFMEMSSLQRIVELGQQVLLLLTFLRSNRDRTAAIEEYNLLKEQLKLKEAELRKARIAIETHQAEKREANREVEKKVAQLRTQMPYLEKGARSIGTGSKQLLNLRQALERVVEQRMSQQNEDHLSVQQQLNTVTEEMDLTRKAISDLETKRSESSLENCNILNTTSMYSSSEYKSLVEQKKKLDTEYENRQNAISHNKNLPHKQWLETVNVMALEAEKHPAMREFLFAPVSNYVEIKADSPIPPNIARFMITIILGRSLFSVVTNSPAYQDKLGNRFREFRDKGGATTVELVKSAFGMEYTEPYEQATQELQRKFDTLKRNTIKTAGVRELSIASTSSSVAFLVDCITGNPIVLNSLFDRLCTAIYIQFSSGYILSVDEIIKLLEANGNLFKTLYHDSILHMGMYNNQGQLVARNIQHFDSAKPYDEFIRINNPSSRPVRFVYDIVADREEINQKLADLKTTYENEAKAREKRAREISLFMSQSTEQLGTLNHKLRELRAKQSELSARIKRYNVVTEQDIVNAEQECEVMSDKVGIMVVATLSRGRQFLNEYRLLAPLLMNVRALQQVTSQLDKNLATLQDEYQTIRKNISVFKENTIDKVDAVYRESKERIQPILNHLFPELAADVPPGQPCDTSALEASLQCLSSHKELTRELERYTRAGMGDSRTSSKDSKSQRNQGNITFTDVASIDVAYFEGFLEKMRSLLKIQRTKQDHTAHEEIIKKKDQFCQAFSTQLVANVVVMHYLLDLLNTVHCFQNEIVEVVQGVSSKFSENMTMFGISGEISLSGMFSSTGNRGEAAATSDLEYARELLQVISADYRLCFDSTELVAALIRNASLQSVSALSANQQVETNPYVAFVMQLETKRVKAEDDIEDDSITVSDENRTEIDGSEGERVISEPEAKRSSNRQSHSATKEAVALLEKMGVLLMRVGESIKPGSDTLSKRKVSDSDDSDIESDSTEVSGSADRTSESREPQRKTQRSSTPFSKDRLKSKKELMQGLTQDIKKTLENAKVKAIQSAIYNFCLNEVSDKQLVSLSEAFVPVVKSTQIQIVMPLLMAMNPGLEVRTRFVQNETLAGVSLSGGESSVVALCLVNSLYGQKALNSIRFRIVDEINQGLDDAFEEKAHEMLCSRRDNTIQYFIGSPKLPSYLRFESPHIRVHIIIRRPLCPRGKDAGIENCCTDNLY